MPIKPFGELVSKTCRYDRAALKPNSLLSNKPFRNYEMNRSATHEMDNIQITRMDSCLYVQYLQALFNVVLKTALLSIYRLCLK